MRLGFIGAGNMAQAMIGGILAKEIVKKEDIIASAATQNTIDKVAKEFGINVTLDNREVAKADIVFLAVKPFYYEEVIDGIKDVVDEKQLIISVAAGKSVEWVENAFGGKKKIVRIMPNTPGHKMNYHSHENRDEVWTIVSGEGRTIVDGMEQEVHTGDVVTMSAGCRHTIIAKTELQVIEVQIGNKISVHDKKTYDLEV